MGELAAPEAAGAVRRSLEECRRVAGPAAAGLAIDRLAAGDGLVVCYCTWPPGRTSPLVFRVAGGRVTACWHRWERDGAEAAPLVDAGDPELAVDEIQAHVLAGFTAPFQTALFVELVDLAAAKRWLGRVARQVTPLAAAPPGGRAARGGLAVAFTFAGLEKLVGEEIAKSSSYAVFCSAIAVGTADLNANANKFAAEDEPDYLLMSVTKARKMGILPIGFKSDAQFAPASATR